MITCSKILLLEKGAQIISEGGKDEKRINRDCALFGTGALEIEERLKVIARKYGLRLDFGYKK